VPHRIASTLLWQYVERWMKAYNSRLEGSGHTRAARAAVLAELETASEHFKPFPWPIAAPEDGSFGQKRFGCRRSSRCIRERRLAW